jgi:hypothetical protein
MIPNITRTTIYYCISFVAEETNHFTKRKLPVEKKLAIANSSKPFTSKWETSTSKSVGILDKNNSVNPSQHLDD